MLSQPGNMSSSPSLFFFFHISVSSILSLPPSVCLGCIAWLNQEAMIPSYLKWATPMALQRRPWRCRKVESMFRVEVHLFTAEPFKPSEAREKLLKIKIKWSLSDVLFNSVGFSTHQLSWPRLQQRSTHLKLGKTFIGIMNEGEAPVASNLGLTKVINNSAPQHSHKKGSVFLRRHHSPKQKLKCIMWALNAQGCV